MITITDDHYVLFPLVNGTCKFDHTKRLITLISDYIKRLSLNLEVYKIYCLEKHNEAPSYFFSDKAKYYDYLMNIDEVGTGAGVSEKAESMFERGRSNNV